MPSVEEQGAVGGQATTASELAAEAFGLAEADPGRARQLATTALARGRVEHDASAVCTAERALGLIAREEHDLPAAVDHLRRAVRTASRARLATDAAHARVTLAGALAFGGDFRSALREVDAAGAVLRGSESTVLDAQRAFLLQVQGRLDEALVAYRRVVPAFQRTADTFREAKARNNLGLILDRLGDAAGAEAELTRAERLYTDLGQHRVAADVRLNLGWIAVHRGELPAALRWFEEADRYFQDQGTVNPISLRDRCEGLLAARLVSEARQVAEQAVSELQRKGMAAFLAEARLVLSEAALLEGDTETARRVAGEARASFTRQRRPGFVALARYAELRAAWMAGDRSAATLGAARRTADALASAGWATHALDARLIVGHVALERGRLGLAREELDRAVHARRRGPVELRTRAWHAEALLRLADGNRRGAQAALRAGVGMLDRYRSTLGATELRVHASAHAADLVGLGVRLALADRAPAGVLHWAERARACALRLRPVRPPSDSTVAATLAELRAVTREQEERTLAGGDVSALLARRARLEEVARRRIRALPGPGLALYRPDPPPSIAELRRTLGDRALVEMVASGDDLHALVVTTRRATLHHLGSVDGVRTEVDALRFALRRLVWTVGSE
ncbi:MAG TPA: tetratricopeptide repeat protein, partial [Egibacteraceae bacterium]|nr:tetratricopeptide repeat protein [Egibacteraceae bacterium]